MAFASPEDKFGIKLESRRAPRTLDQNFSLIAGLVYVTIGVIGFFFTGFGSFTEMTDRALFGIFPLNPFHNIVHIGVGALWLLGALALTSAGNQGINIAIGGFYVLAAILGFLGYLSLVSVSAGFDPDNFLHLVSGVLPLIFGSGLLSGQGGRQTATA
ncbi:MAG: DUF4383 domain-containing protein [Actinomycetota bacterium]|nr:DUF4383 domain-containing protein [Actinomycetota bacterium]